jgi:glycerate-2-kinase
MQPARPTNLVPTIGSLLMWLTRTFIVVVLVGGPANLLFFPHEGIELSQMRVVLLWRDVLLNSCATDWGSVTY